MRKRSLWVLDILLGSPSHLIDTALIIDHRRLSLSHGGDEEHPSF